MADPVFEAFSLTHAQVLDGATAFGDVVTGDASWGDIYGVNSGSLDADTDQFVNEGDDTQLSEWNWVNGADVNVQAGYMSFPLISNLTGQPISSSGAGNTELFAMDLWHEDSFNVPPRPMILRMPSKDKLGVIRTFDIGLYRVDFRPITFDGPAYKEGLKINYIGRARMSAWDELGATFADGKKRVGRLISRGVA